MSTTDEKGIKEAVKRFILSSISVAKLDDDDNLFESGIVNSLFAVQLMTFIEKTFAIDVMGRVATTSLRESVRMGVKNAAFAPGLFDQGYEKLHAREKMYRKVK